MKHEICDACETVKHCSQHGCIPLQPQSPKPCRSPYCECTPGQCSHPGCYDARSEPFAHPPAQPTVDWREAVLDLIDECPGLTMDQDRWLTQRVKEIATAPATQRQLVGLTNHEREEVMKASGKVLGKSLARAIVAKLLEKNAAAPVQPVQPVQPVAWMHTSGHIQIFHPHWEQVAVDGYTREKGWTPLYTTPQRQWVGLTDEQIIGMYNEPRSDAEMIAFGREVEAKLKEKNT